MFDDNPIIVNSSSNRRNKKLKIFCVLCFPKVQLKCIISTPPEDGEELRYKCPRCKNTYQLGYEILEHEDDIVSSHEDEADDIELTGLESDSGVGLLTKDNELDFPSLDEQYYEDKERGKIPIPKYMKDSVTTKVIEYNEENE